MDYIPGVCAGISQTLVGQPFDTIKTRIQNKQSWRDLGIRGYYRGSLPIFIGSTLFNGALFPTYHYVKKELQCSTWFAGGITGIVVTPFMFWFENAKILKQTQTPFIRDIFFNGNGYGTTMAREISAVAIYFSTYEHCKQQGLPIFLSGAISGVTNWLFTYPLDVIRTRQIAQNISFKQAFQQKGLYQGIGIVLLRSSLVNGVLFSTYEGVQNIINDNT